MRPASVAHPLGRPRGTGIAKKKNLAMALTLIAIGRMHRTYTWFDARGPLSFQTVAVLATKMLLSGIEAVQAPGNDAGAGKDAGAAIHTC